MSSFFNKEVLRLIDGRAYLNIYSNVACTRLFTTDGTNITMELGGVATGLTSSASYCYYIKNDGSIQANSITITTTNPNVTITSYPKTLNSGEVKPFKFTLNIPQGFVGNLEFNFSMTYDSL